MFLKNTDSTSNKNPKYLTFIHKSYKMYEHIKIIILMTSLRCSEMRF